MMTSEGPGLVEASVNFAKYGLSLPMVTDVDDVRLTVVGPKGIPIKISLIWKLLKDMVGKDLSKFSMPVFINEPTSILQKAGEFMFYTDYLTRASEE
jgi:hypothetical protein